MNKSKETLESVLCDYGAVKVTAIELYSKMFHLGEGYIQKSDEESGGYKANPLVYYKNQDEEHGHYRILFEDTFENMLKLAQKADFSILNGVTYYGRRNTLEAASKMYAMIFDLDGVTVSKLKNFLNAAYTKEYKIYPIPNYIILSGGNIHLYYLFEEPIPLFPNIKLQLKEFKYALIKLMWNIQTSEEKKIQFQGINQGFRVVGGKAKEKHHSVEVKAYKLNDRPYLLEELNEYVPQAMKIDDSKLFRESKYTLEDAKKKFPDWYQKVIVEKNRIAKKWDISGKVNGENPYALYEWWLRHLTNFSEYGVQVGHRYFCLMCLAIYAAKADVPYERLKKDAYSLVPLFNSISVDDEFTYADADSALECYDQKYCTFPIKDLSRLSGIQIDKNKRNFRKQSAHMAMISVIRDTDYPDGSWRNKDGRPTKKDVVLKWKKDNPAGRKAECIKETGLSKGTVYKWWNSNENL